MKYSIILLPILLILSSSAINAADTNPESEQKDHQTPCATPGIKLAEILQDPLHTDMAKMADLSKEDLLRVIMQMQNLAKERSPAQKPHPFAKVLKELEEQKKIIEEERALLIQRGRNEFAERIIYVVPKSMHKLRADVADVGRDFKDPFFLKGDEFFLFLHQFIERFQGEDVIKLASDLKELASVHNHWSTKYEELSNNKNVGPSLARFCEIAALADKKGQILAPHVMSTKIPVDEETARVQLLLRIFFCVMSWVEQSEGAVLY